MKLDVTASRLALLYVRLERLSYPKEGIASMILANASVQYIRAGQSEIITKELDQVQRMLEQFEKEKK